MPKSAQDVSVCISKGPWLLDFSITATKTAAIGCVGHKTGPTKPAEENLRYTSVLVVEKNSLLLSWSLSALTQLSTQKTSVTKAETTQQTPAGYPLTQLTPST